MIDTAKQEQFGERMVTSLNAAGLMLLTSIGHRTGLWDALADGHPRTSDQLASETGLFERYVREWLAGAATAGVVDYDPITRTFTLPPEHASCLSRKAGADNLATYAQYVAVCGAVEDDIVECFQNGGGVPYERYGRFHAVMAEDSAQTVVSALFDHILPLVDGLEPRLEEGMDVLDVGCGSGRALLAMAGRYPNSRFVGYDLSSEAIAGANAEAANRKLTNVHFAVRDLTSFDAAAAHRSFDLVTAFDAIHDQAAPLAVLTGVYRSLRRGGVFLMQDIQAHTPIHENFDHPLGVFLYTISTMHCMSVSLSQGGQGLGTMWGREKAVELLLGAGFDMPAIHQLPHDIQNDYYVCRKPIGLD